jgi:uncharacterized protein DUF1876
MKAPIVTQRGSDMSNSSTWQVDITLSELEGRVTAEAHLASGLTGVSGVGYARVTGDDSHPERVYTLAARRSLEALSGAMEYAIDAGTLSSADQA